MKFLPERLDLRHERFLGPNKSLKNDTQLCPCSTQAFKPSAEVQMQQVNVGHSDSPWRSKSAANVEKPDQQLRRIIPYCILICILELAK